jgi:hypothetical protein
MHDNQTGFDRIGERRRQCFGLRGVEAWALVYVLNRYRHARQSSSNEPKYGKDASLAFRGTLGLRYECSAYFEISDRVEKAFSLTKSS